MTDHRNRKKNLEISKKSGGEKDRLFSFKNEKWRIYFLRIIFVVSLVMFLISVSKENEREKTFLKKQQQIKEQKIVEQKPIEKREVTGIAKLEILPEYKKLYEKNSDMVGWLRIKDTVIDYPVMQTMEDEQYYLQKNFDKEYDENGCLIMDTDSVVGQGKEEDGYEEEQKPSTNLLIHGHAMKSGSMFGNLNLYQDEEYGREHHIIYFDSIYEKREYEVISVFYSQVFYRHDEVFKYYNFFQADTQEEFDNWYKNIKKMSLYDTGVNACFGDEFITLSTCSYHVEDGRFVVVGKRK